MNLTISQLEIIREALVQAMRKTDDEGLKREIIEITTIIKFQFQFGTIKRL